jgi:hypothetical protein
MKFTIITATIMCTLAAGATSGGAQWLDHPTPNLPRTADGKPRLNGPSPRVADGHPDLSGVWTGPSAAMAPPDDVLRPVARALIARREENFFKERPLFQCLPNGPEPFTLFKSIIQAPGAIVMLYENLNYRVIHTDGRKLEPDPGRTWMGYSVGQWQGDTLVVQSNGFNDRTWLTSRGLPHSELLRTTERYSRPTAGTIHVEVTITDPEMFTRPWTDSYDLILRADTEMVEGVCETDQSHWVGTLADTTKDAVRLDAAVLARYVGTYSGRWGQRIRTVRITLVDGVLHSNGVIGEPVQLVPQSERFFFSSDGYSYEFGGDIDGKAAFVVERHVSGDWKYMRQP